MAHYIASKSGSLEIADRLIESITDRFWRLVLNLIWWGHKRDEDLCAGLRSFPVGEYVILYRIQGEDIFILHVMHGSRNMPSLL